MLADNSLLVFESLRLLLINVYNFYQKKIEYSGKSIGLEWIILEEFDHGLFNLSSHALFNYFVI